MALAEEQPEGTIFLIPSRRTVPPGHKLSSHARSSMVDSFAELRAESTILDRPDERLYDAVH
jgi:hypothetical protein